MNSKYPSCNDIVAISNHSGTFAHEVCLVVGIQTNFIYLDGFRVGKVVEVQEKMINVTLFHYKLDIKTETVMNDDIIINFGPHQSKSIFEMNDEQQKMLLNRIYERGTVVCVLALRYFSFSSV